MIGQSLQEYVSIRLCIIGFCSVAPASIIYLAASAFCGQLLYSPWLALAAIPEALFYLLVYIPRHSRLQKPAKHTPPPLDRAERQALFVRCSNHITDDDYPTGWFLTPDIKRDNAIDWILWALFSCEPHEALEEWQEELDGYISTIEKMLGRKLEEGRNEKVKSMRLTFDPVVMLHRPLLWYTIVGGVDTYTSLTLMSLGFKHHAPPAWFQAFPPRPATLFSKSTPDLPYWYRPHRSTTKLPLLFIHGIGIGLYPYIPLIREIIASDPTLGILLVELLPISMHITHPLLPRPKTTHAISDILATHSLPSVVLASHSYGTVITAHILHSPFLSSKISATLMIDPIPFLLHLPNVAYNFVYRKPKRGNEWQLWYFASRDADISRALSRCFFWAENVMWREELGGGDVSNSKDMGEVGPENGVPNGHPNGYANGFTNGDVVPHTRRKTGVVLSGDDQIVHAREVWKYLTGEEEIKRRWVGSVGATGEGMKRAAGAGAVVGAEEGKGAEGEGDLEVLFYPGLDHATVFDTKERRKGVLDILDRFTRGV